MRYRELLEAPLDGYELHGDWSDKETHHAQPVIQGYGKDDLPDEEMAKLKGNSFVSKFDRALIQKPETEAALRKVFARFNIPIYLFFLNSEEGLEIAKGYLDHGELEDSTYHTNPNSAHRRVKELLGPGVYKRFREIRIDQPEACIVVLTHNEGGPMRHPLTPWMIVHRIAHAYGVGGNILEAKSEELLKIASAYGFKREDVRNVDIPTLRFAISKAICTFRAAREDNILANSGVEMGAELFTQFVMQGRVKLRLPAEFQGNALDPSERPKAQAALRVVEDYVNLFLGAAEGNMRGKVYVC